MTTEFHRLAVALAVSQALKEAGSWCGETHIQKASYLLSQLRHVNPGWDFVLYKHGPYSFDLHDDLVTAQAMGLLTQRTQRPYGPSLEVSDDGLRLLNLYSPETQEALANVSFVADRVGPKNIFELEKLATAVYVSEEAPGESEEQRVTKLRELKPHVSEAAAITAVEEAVRLIEESSTTVPG